MVLLSIATLTSVTASTGSITTTTNLRSPSSQNVVVPSISRNLDSDSSMIDVGGRRQAKKADPSSPKGSGTQKSTKPSNSKSSFTSKNKKGDSFFSFNSIDEASAPETTVHKSLSTQSPAHELLILLENDEDFLEFLFGEPSSIKSSESKSKGSNGSVKGKSSVDDDGEEEAPSQKKDKLASEKKQKPSSKSKTDSKKNKGSETDVSNAPSMIPSGMPSLAPSTAARLRVQTIDTTGDDDTEDGWDQLDTKVLVGGMGGFVALILLGLGYTIMSA
jgi:hypothetical protein